MTSVSSNVVELIAMVEGILALPEGWSGHIGSDSIVSIHRLKLKKPKLKGVPTIWKDRTWEARRRMGPCVFDHLFGHPSKDDLFRGFKIQKGRLLPVSKWNVWCDDKCTELAQNIGR